MPPTLAELMSKVPQAFIPEQAGDANAIVHFKFTGTEPGEWNATIHDGKCEVARGIPRAQPTITVVADSDDFRNMVTGQLDPSAAYMAGKLKVTGNMTLAMKLVGLFRVE